MVLRPISSSLHHDTPAGLAAAVAATPVRGWLRRAVSDAQSLATQGAGPDSLEEVALVAGAAIAALDTVVRQRERWAGAWRQRLALTAAALAVRQVDRVEDEAALRDAVLLTRPGDDVGPVSRILLAWRRLATRPTEDLLKGKSLATVLEEFGHAPDNETVNDLAEEFRRLSVGGMLGALTGAFGVAERSGVGRAAGAWFADALVAQRLGWKHAMPLLGAEVIVGLDAGRPR